MAGRTFFCISFTVTVQSMRSLSSPGAPGAANEIDFVSPTSMPTSCRSNSSGMRPIPMR